MRLLIIQPSHYRTRTGSQVHKTRKRTVVGLTLPYLAALTPRGWDITVVDEQLTEIDFGAAVDLVAITTWTINSLRAYEIADRYREMGIPVIMGGPHTYFYPEEAAQHCDGVGIGEGETIWPKMIEDAAAGRLKKIYRADGPHNLKGLPSPRHDLLNPGRYGIIKTHAVQSSRGCPFRCEFCSERFYLGHQYRYRPVEEVIEEIKRTGSRNIFFADSNFAGKTAHTMELMEAFIALKVRWSTLWPAYLCKNREFMDLAKRSGLLHVNIGLESIDRPTLAAMNKKVNKATEYREIFNQLRRRGISYSVNFIFGWDTETPSVFPSTLAFLKRHRVPAAYFNILTPHRGTPFYDRMKAEGRILDEYHIGRWPGIICYIKPAYCSAPELEEHVRAMYRGFYTLPSMLARLPLPVTMGNMASWAVNLSQRKVFRPGRVMENFDEY